MPRRVPPLIGPSSTHYRDPAVSATGREQRLAVPAPSRGYIGSHPTLRDVTPPRGARYQDEAMNSLRQDALLKCSFCGTDKRWGVCGETRSLFVCDDCIALMVNIRRTALGDDAWPHSE